MTSHLGLNKFNADIFISNTNISKNKYSYLYFMYLEKFVIEMYISVFEKKIPLKKMQISVAKMQISLFSLKI